MKKYKAVFFDLFFTLIIPSYYLKRNENDVLGISIEEYEKYAEDENLYYNRAIGNVMNPMQVISDIIKSMSYNINENKISEILELRKDRMRHALINVDSIVIETIKELHNEGIKIGLISNADIIDCSYWGNSELAKYFDDAVFSCYAKCLKPDKEIYERAMEKLNVKAEECLFVGDGGSNELFGAKEAKMDTVFTEYLDTKNIGQKSKIEKFADYHITDFSDLNSIVKGNIK